MTKINPEKHQKVLEELRQANTKYAALSAKYDRLRAAYDELSTANQNLFNELEGLRT